MANNALKKPTASDIENMGDKIGNSLIEAQCALYALTAIHEVSKKNPSLDRGLPLLTQIIWRALFDRLYIKIGTVIEQSEKAANLQNLKKIAVQYVAEDQEALTFLFDLPTTNEKWDTLRTWRNKTIAHNDLAVDAMTLYAEQKMHVTEYQPIINELFDVLNTLSGVAINKIYQQADWQALYFSEASRLFSNDFNVDAPPLRPA